jgi:hypothetical protein
MTAGGGGPERYGGVPIGDTCPMARDDDDDWTGTPPEGRHTRDRAKPEFWASQRPLVPAGVGVVLVLLVVLLIVLLG